MPAMRTERAGRGEARVPSALRMFMAALLTETNTFAPLPTGHDSFHNAGFHRTGGSLARPAWANIPLIEWRRLAEAAQLEVVESLCADARSAGTTVRATYEGLRDAILNDLRHAGPVDIVLLNLHGAMVTEGYDDCEADLVARARDIVRRDCVIGVELDLHCHIDERLIGVADLVVTYKEYPHTDMTDRARDLFALAQRAARREVRPVLALRDLRMINMWHTTREPVRSLVADMLAEEAAGGGLLSLSFAHGFAYGDVPHVGAKMLAIADGDLAMAAAAAERWGARIWSLREATRQRYDTPDEAIDAAPAAVGGTTVVAETSDNAGGGAPSDCTAVLARLLARGVRDAAALQSGEVDWWEEPSFDLMPLLARNRQVAIEQLEQFGAFSTLRVNHLVPPFNNPAFRRAIWPALNQSDVMLAVAGTDRARWNTPVGFFTPGTPLASDAGMGNVAAPRSLDAARRAIAASGYRGERLAFLHATDIGSLDAMSHVIADMFRRLGLNLDHAVTDWGTVVQRRARREPVKQGGWSAFCTNISGADPLMPPTHQLLRANGTNAWFGWPDSPDIERGVQDWFAAPGPAEAQRIARGIQEAAFRDVPYHPLGQFRRPAAFRRDLTGMVRSATPVVWNVGRAA